MVQREQKEWMECQAAQVRIHSVSACTVGSKGRSSLCSLSQVVLERLVVLVYQASEVSLVKWVGKAQWENQEGLGTMAPQG